MVAVGEAEGSNVGEQLARNSRDPILPHKAGMLMACDRTEMRKQSAKGNGLRASRPYGLRIRTLQ